MQIRELIENLLLLPPHITSKLDKHQQYSLSAPLVALRITFGFAIGFAANYKVTGVGRTAAFYTLMVGAGFSILFGVFAAQLVARSQEKGLRGKRDRASTYS